MKYGKIKFTDTVYIENSNGEIKFVDVNNVSGVTLSNVGGGGNNSFRLSFESTDLAIGVLAVNHNLSNKYVVVEVYNSLDEKVIPDQVELVDSNNLNVDLSSFTVTGTWNVVIPGLVVAYTKEESGVIFDGYIGLGNYAGYHDLEHSPVALYQFNNNLNDSSGNGFNLSVDVGTPQYMMIDSGLYGVYLDGTTRLVSGVQESLQIAGDVTVECIVSNFNPTQANSMIVVS